MDRVGIFTANYINALIEYGALNLSKLSLIGFSLGAHVAGIGELPLIFHWIIVIVNSYRGLTCFLFVFSWEKCEKRQNSKNHWPWSGRPMVPCGQAKRTPERDRCALCRNDSHEQAGLRPTYGRCQVKPVQHLKVILLDVLRLMTFFVCLWGISFI